ncbi:hypothetical protein [Baekduia soli]|nr:hypothetical protein [Baekduia soli]
MLAAGLEQAVGDADGRPRLSCRIPVARDRVRAHAPDLLAVAGVLRSARQLPSDGLDVVHALLTDGAGPLYLGGPALDEAVEDLQRRLGLR